MKRHFRASNRFRWDELSTQFRRIAKLYSWTALIERTENLEEISREASAGKGNVIREKGQTHTHSHTHTHTHTYLSWHVIYYIHNTPRKSGTFTVQKCLEAKTFDRY
jgi:predicted glycoside hydrolase/deacetylase ChbG (UPF0249 family)